MTSAGEMWVLYFDVMGASRAVASPVDRDRLIRAYTAVADGMLRGEYLALFQSVLNYSPQRGTGGSDAALARAREAAGRRWTERFRVFSDSLFVFFDSPSDAYESPTNPRYLPHIAGSISRTLWRHSLPHRGSISTGFSHLDVERQVFLGEAIVRAYRWEQQQEWLGVSVSPESLDAAKVLFGDIPYLNLGDLPARPAPISTAYLDAYTPVRYDVWQPGYSDDSLRGFLDALARATRQDYATDSERTKVLQRYRFTATMFRDHIGDYDPGGKRLLVEALDELAPLLTT